MKVVCSSCGRIVRGKIPKGGDGSVVVPYRHHQGFFNKVTCSGSFQDAKVFDEQKGGSE